MTKIYLFGGSGRLRSYLHKNSYINWLKSIVLLGMECGLRGGGPAAERGDFSEGRDAHEED